MDDFEGYMTTSYEDLLNDPEIAVIDICLPTFLHESFIIKAAKAGKQIICEKPLTLTTGSAERVRQAIEQNDVQLYVGHVLRFWPEYQTINTYQKEGELKDIEIVQAHRLGQAPNWSDWFQKPEKSGGALYDLHIHDIDYTAYLLGRADSVYATGIQNEQGAWAHVMTMMTFQNGSKAILEASHRMPETYPFSISYRVQAKDSTIELQIEAGENIDSIEANNNQLNFYTEGKNLPLQAGGEDAFVNELAYFIACITENKANEVIPLTDVFYTLQLLEAVEQSLNTGKVVNM